MEINSFCNSFNFNFANNLQKQIREHIKINCILSGRAWNGWFWRKKTLVLKDFFLLFNGYPCKCCWKWCKLLFQIFYFDEIWKINQSKTMIFTNFSNNVKNAYFSALPPSFFRFHYNKKFGTLSWTISNNFCFILFPLWWISFFWS